MTGRWVIPAMAASLLFLPFPGATAHETHTRAARQGYQRSVEKYAIADVKLVSQDRMEIPLKEFLESDRPVLMNFIFATCTTICPVLSASFHHVQEKLGDKNGEVRLVSITIDPEHDTPEAMKKFLKRYRAKSGWTFLTGSRENINQVMRAFDAFVPDKMSHRPLTFLRSQRDGRWVRIDGLISAEDLLKEYRALLED